MSRRPFLPLVLALAFVGVGAVAGEKQQGQQERLPVPVVVTQAEQRSMPLEVRTIGTIQAESTVTVRSRIDGEIVGIHFKEGDDIDAGALLFTLDDRQQRVAVAQAEAALAKDRATLANAQRELQRYAPLADREVVSRQKLDEARTIAVVAEAATKVDEALLAHARLLLSYTEIRAAFPGRAGTLNFDKGNNVRSTDPLVVLNQVKPIRVAFSVAQKELPLVRAGQAKGALPVRVTVPGDEAGAIEGSLYFIDNAVDVATGTVMLKARFSNEPLRLWPGQLVNVALVLRTDAHAVVVPDVAIQSGQEGPYVFVVKDRVADVRRVQVARSQDGLSVIAKGLAPGETVVVDGQFRLAPGVPVDIRPGRGQGALAAREGGST